MLILCLLVIFIMFPLGTLDTIDVTSLVNVTGYVGETIELKCFDPSTADKFNKEVGDVKWMYLFQEDCSHNPSYVHVATCENGYWEYLSYGHHLVGDDDSCDNGLAYMRSKEPGNFTYKCELTSYHTTNEVTFLMNVNAREHLLLSSCIAKHVPPTRNLIFDFICTNYHRDCLSNEKDDTDFFILQNGTRIAPDIISVNKLIARGEIHNISSISQYYCITDNNSSPCVVDSVTLTNPVGITPLVNKVTTGSDVTFVCTLENGHEHDESGVKYNWRLSRHIQFSRISDIASSTLKIRNVQYKDDGVIVMCELDVNGSTVYSEAFLKILPENSNPTVLTESTTFTRYLLDNVTMVMAKVSNASGESEESCKRLMMYFLIPVFGVLLTAAVVVLVVYCWTASDVSPDVLQSNV